MIALALAALSALVYGVSDFLGGLNSRRSHYIWVTLFGQISLTVGACLWLIWRPGTPTLAALGWGVLAAVGHVFGTLMLMRGLSSGAMHVAGPLSAVVGAALPVFVGVVSGERPAALAWVGIAAALPAVWLVASGQTADPDVAGGPGVASASGRGPGAPEGARDGVLAGLGFALFFVAVAKPDASSGAWPLVTLEASALVMMVIVALIVRPPGRLVDGRWGLLVGVLGFAGVVTYFLATQTGMLSLVVVVTSLYPAFTVLLAMLTLGERPAKRQLVGLAIAAASVVLIALGH